MKNSVHIKSINKYENAYYSRAFSIGRAKLNGSFQPSSPWHLSFAASGVSGIVFGKCIEVVFLQAVLQDLTVGPGRAIARFKVSGRVKPGIALIVFQFSFPIFGLAPGMSL
jgi:hypothetical protein